MTTRTPAFPRHYGPLLHGRSRGLPGTVAALTAVAVLAALSAHRSGPHADLIGQALAPVLAAAAIGTGLHQHSAELEGTAVRPWWPRRLAHLLGLTLFAAAVLALAVSGHGQDGAAPPTVRDLLGAVGLTAGCAVLTGARASWVPTVVCLGAVQLAGDLEGVGGAARLPAGPAAWTVALLLWAVGTTALALRGPRPGRG